MKNTKYNYNNFFIVLLVFCCATIYAQPRIDGPTSVLLGETHRYYVLGARNLTYVQWTMGSVNNGIVVQSAHNYADIQFTRTGTVSVSTAILYDGGTPGSPNMQVSVADLTIPGNPTISQNNCGQLILRRNGSPPNGYTWYWQGTDSNGTSTTKGFGEYYTANEGNGTYYIRARSNSTGYWSSGSGSITSNINSLSPGSIDREGQMVFCINGNPGNIINDTSPSGGSGGYTYQWQYSNNGTSGWTNISGATSNSYNPPGGLSASRWYRRRVTSCSGQNVYSNTVKATVHPPLQGGTIDGQDAICYRDNPGILGNVTSPSGGFGSTSYQWEVSLDNSSWSQISGATSLTYDPPGDQTQTKWYRRRVISCEQTKYSNTVTVTVHPLLDPPTGSGAVSRCGTGTVTLSLTPDTDANSLRWYTSETGGSYIYQGTSYTTPSISGETTYYASSYDTGSACESTVRKAVTITINTMLTWYLDADGDGHAISQTMDCSSPGSGYTQTVLPLDDCNDSDATLNPDTVWYLDGDNDGHAAGQTISCTSPGVGYTRTVLPVDDCNDADNTISGETTWYEDLDGDGFGDPTNYITQCTIPVGYVLDNSDLCPMLYDAANSCDSSGSNPVTADNYIYTRTYQLESLTAPNFFTENDTLIQQIVYHDGLGRPVQQIGIDQTPSKYDIVTHMAYDDYARLEKEYLPYPTTDAVLGTYRTDALSSTNMHYNTQKYQNTTNPFSQKEFEPSPLNRVLKQAAPGEDWKLIKNTDDHSIEFVYLTNIQNPNDANDPDNDNVRLFQVDLSGGDENPALAENGFYSEGELFKNVTKDENHDTADGKLHTTEEFTDKLGRVVLKRTYADADIDLDGDGNNTDPNEILQAPHDTYYVYDDYGNLTYVLPPKMEASTASLTDINTQMAELGYQYVYDHRNRLVEKQIPGKGEEFIIYNKLDQPIMTQDANQRANSPDEWLFTKYDGHGRVAYTGIAVETGDYSREQIQAEVDALTDPLWVIQSSAGVTFGGTDIYYDNGAYPNNITTPNMPRVTLDEVLTINYYDSYVDGPSSAPATVTLLGSDPVATNRGNVQGLPTGSRVKVLDVTGLDVWINTRSYYDDKGRVIQTYSDNAYLGTVDIVETQLDFIGKPIKVRSSHTRNGVTLVTLDNFTYDHVGRLLAQTQCIGDGTLGDECPAAGNLDADLVWDGLGTINSDTEATQSITVRNADIVPGTGGTTLRIVDDGGQELIVYNNYDELGQLEHKKVGGTSASDYATAQGLQEVDYSYNVRGWLTDINDISDVVPNKLFNFSLSYNQEPNPLYNGNIAQAQWRTASTDNTLKSYGYTYDALNRITGALDNSGNYDVSNITYDKMGNILTLTRDGWQDNSGTITYPDMDILDYDYGPGNKLTKVSDTGNADYGFRDGANTNDDFVYDANGNLEIDRNKGITGVTYNHLNLPTGVAINGSGGNGTIDYIYDATGIKLKKTVSSTGNSIEYAGNFVYENGTLQFFSHSEGYINANGGGYEYVYQYKDHLGNVRVSYTDDPSNPGQATIIEENNYYPFGGRHLGYNMGGDNSLGNDLAQMWKFGGKEFDESLGLETYDFGARNYDPALGRWMNLDPLAEQYLNMSPYNHTLNNPIIFVDPDGMRVEWGEGLDGDEKELLGYAIYQLRKNSETFDKAFSELHSSDMVFTVGKASGAWGLFTRPSENIEGGGEDDEGLPTPVTLSYDMSEGADGGRITVDLDLFKSLQAEGNDIDPLQETMDVFPEEFSGAALFLYYATQANGISDEMPAAANVEYETKMLSGIILNEAGIDLSRGQNQRKAQQFGIDFSKGKYTIGDYFNALKTWHQSPKTNKYYRGLSRDGSRPEYTENLRK